MGRRARHRRIDGSIVTVAAAALAAGLIGLAMLLFVSQGSERDPQAAADLVARLRAGEHATYVAEYRFTRVRPDGQRFSATTLEAHGPKATITRSGEALTVETPTKRYECQRVDGKAGCFERPRVQALPLSEVVRVAVDVGAYDVTRRPGTTIAGEPASCFLVRAHAPNHQAPGLGIETEMCLARDGIPLRTRDYEDDVLNEREALRVVRRFDDPALAPVLAGFEAAKQLLPR